MTNEELWQAALGELELLVSRANFTTWFRHTFIASRDSNGVVIAVPNGFTKAWLESKYHTSIVKALQNITKSTVQVVRYEVGVASRPQSSLAVNPAVATQSATVSPTAPTSTTNGLNPAYTFDAFVVGKGNELARAASVAVADRPGVTYNPLFIYGDAGLGKTHLLHAIGHEVLRQSPDRRVRYVTCEQFMSDFVNAVKKGGAEDFKKRYRMVDVLLVDDIAFLAGREGTQQEFFHTFNTLYDARKQIVLTSDRPPKSIPTLEDRLVSRFEWGMIADITSPDLETRIAILETKCRVRELTLDAEIIQYIATSVASNIRELEGVLNRIIAYHQLNGTPPSLETAKTLLSSVAGRRKQSGLTPKQVVTVVAGFFDVSVEELGGDSRKKELVIPRQIAMYLLREELKSSFPAIGQELGGRDHTTAMHACTKITKELERDDKIKQDINLIRQRLYVK